MDNTEIAQKIRTQALALGYEKCGIVPVQEMAGYADALARRMEEYPADRPFLERLAGFANIQQAIPWARSVIVLARTYGKYAIPSHLRGHIASAYLTGEIHVEGSRDNADSRAFGDCLTELGLKAVTDRKHGLTAMRWAAQKAGLGIIRKNNFFYTESGSWVLLSAWLIDRALEQKEESALKPCPDDCQRCIDSCPTSALQRPYSMRPAACVAFLTGFDGSHLPDNLASAAMGGWIYGCDACQSACPHNQVRDRETCEYPGLRELGERVSLTQIVAMDMDTIKELFADRFWYISEERLWKWKVNALNAMKNEYKEEYLPWIQKACDDPSEQVRTMAAWVLHNTMTTD